MIRAADAEGGFSRSRCGRLFPRRRAVDRMAIMGEMQEAPKGVETQGELGI